MEDWLDHFERVATFNGWDDERKRKHVYFSLEDSAQTWFENRKSTMPSWEEFRQRLLAAYTNSDRKEKAEAALQARNQRPNESVAMYAEDMARLFRRADSAMTDEKQVRHLMRGVKQEIFAGLIRCPPRTVDEFVREATTIERALHHRARHYNRDEPVVSSVTEMEGSGLRELVRQIVREELQRLQQGQVSPASMSVAEIVREEIRQAVRMPEQVDVLRQDEPRSSYAAAVRQPVYNAPSTVAAVAPQPILELRPRSTTCSSEAGRRKSDLWRTPDRRPLCFHCGEAGHVYRACPYRRAGLRGFAPNAPRPQSGQRPPEIADYIAERRNVFSPPRPQSRSPSPIRRRSLSPRFPRDPATRLPGSPEGRGN